MEFIGKILALLLIVCFVAVGVLAGLNQYNIDNGIVMDPPSSEETPEPAPELG